MTMHVISSEGELTVYLETGHTECDHYYYLSEMKMGLCEHFSPLATRVEIEPGIRIKAITSLHDNQS